MKEIVIEEIISQTFVVEDNVTIDDVWKMYNDCELVLDDATATEVNVQMDADEEFINIQ